MDHLRASATATSTSIKRDFPKDFVSLRGHFFLSMETRDTATLSDPNNAKMRAKFILDINVAC